MKNPAKVSTSTQEVKIQLSGFYPSLESNDTLYLKLPCVELPRFIGPLISDELRQWTEENGINESVYGRAYEEAHKAFFDTLERQMLLELLADRIELPKREREPKSSYDEEFERI